MSKQELKEKKLKILYENLYRSYYVHSILNKILLGEDDFSNLEITTLSLLSDRYLNTAKKQVLSLIAEYE